MEIAKKYNPKEVEPKWEKFWTEKNLYQAGKDKNKKPYVIMMPPPNVTGMLHMGHVLNNTLQDIYARYMRMKGYDVLWLPGVDHAGIATQNVVEKELAKEGKTRFELGREKFVERVYEWKKKYEEIIKSQLRRLGCSCDWTRYRFTMDKIMSKAVLEAFVKLYKKGLIYRGKYIVNFCPRCETTLSDEEVEREEVNGKLYYIKYPLEEKGKFVTLATTRPETMLGDTAVAVHPEDKRYKDFVGKYAILPFIGRKLKIIEDESVDPEFGTGAVKVTPSHDPVDFEIAKKHNLPFVTIMDTKGIINEEGGEFKGLDRFKAREEIIKRLQNMGLLEKVEDYKINLGKCYRCETVIEPYLSEQWFLKMKEMAQKAFEAGEKGEVKFYPPSWKKLYDIWLLNVKDWVISRQLWWGHRIPVYYCENCKNEMVSTTHPLKCDKCSSTKIKQDEDVLDTWFSSWLFPFSTLGWPENTTDLERYYPGSLLVSAWDILYFWVARMIMAGIEFLGKVPFKSVLIHGLLRDEKRRKLSKSLGNSPDPEDLFDKYGVDGVRFSLISIAPEGRDIIFSEEKMKIGRNFCNKMWNALRLLLTYIDEGKVLEYELPKNLEFEDKWILMKFNEALKNVNYSLENYDYPELAKSIYNFFWLNYCDYYLEAIKDRLKDEKRKTIALKVALIVFEKFLRMAHPVIPFITEELWHKLPFKREKESISLTEWVTEFDINFEREKEEFEFLIKLIELLREIKGIYRIPLKENIRIFIKEEKDKRFKDLLNYLAKASVLEKEPEKNYLGYVINEKEIIVEFPERINIEEEKIRIEKEIKELENLLAGIEKRLKNPEFLEKAPEKVIKETEEKKRIFEEKLNSLKKYLK
ncbi:MAG: valine--tRNA ligase [candidate division WOR-3 bacterium]